MTLPAIKKLQQRLANLSFLPAADVDGWATPETSFAVTGFQDKQCQPPCPRRLIKQTPSKPDYLRRAFPHCLTTPGS